MGEAIFAKYGKSSNAAINSASLISNSVKTGLGLGPNATLDDCFKSLIYRSDTMASIIVTVRDIDGSVVPNANVHMNVPTGTGANLVYKTDNQGQCIFKTNAGTANFSDHAYDDYIDVNGQTNIKVDCPVGTVKEITLQRYKVFQNGGTVGNFNSNRTINFSKWAKTADITVSGEGGQGGACSSVLIPGQKNQGLKFGYKGSTIISKARCSTMNGISKTNVFIVNSTSNAGLSYFSIFDSNGTVYPQDTGSFINKIGCNGLAASVKINKMYLLLI